MGSRTPGDGRCCAPTNNIAPRIAVEATEHAARTLLNRYGVVFWSLLTREAGWLPPWRDLLRVYRRWEARGEIRGGRFVAGFSGEQFALPEAIGLLRETRKIKGAGEMVSLSAADPLNLVGILTPGPKLPPLAGNRVLYRDGLPIATLAGGEAQFRPDLEPGTEWEAQKALIRGPGFMASRRSGQIATQRALALARPANERTRKQALVRITEDTLPPRFVEP